MVKVSGSGNPSSASNPYITKTISKTLLTPCRQIGLSRKRKTPNSLVKSPPNVSSLQVATTPLTSQAALQVESKSVDSKVETEALDVVVPRILKKVSRCLPMVEKNSIGKKCETDKTKSSNESNSKPESKKVAASKAEKTKSKSNVNKSILQKPVKKDTKVSEDGDWDSSDNELLGFKLDDGGTAVLRPKKKYRISTNDECSSQEVNESKGINTTKTPSSSRKSSIEVSTIEENLEEEDEDFQPKVIKRKKIKPIFDDESSSSQETVLEDKPCISVYSAQSLKQNGAANDDFHVKKKPERSSNHCSNSLEDRPVFQKESETKPKPFKRSLSMKKSSNEESVETKSTNFQLKSCLVRLNSFEEAAKISPTKAAELEKIIKEKRRLLEDLKQAEVYKKIHNVDNLKQLTSTWKSGCISALNDLLPQLNAHSPMSMATLLTNLRVPQQLITLSPDGELM